MDLEASHKHSPLISGRTFRLVLYSSAESESELVAKCHDFMRSNHSNGMQTSARAQPPDCAEFRECWFFQSFLARSTRPSNSRGIIYPGITPGVLLWVRLRLELILCRTSEQIEYSCTRSLVQKPKQTKPTNSGMNWWNIVLEYRVYYWKRFFLEKLFIACLRNEFVLLEALLLLFTFHYYRPLTATR